MPEGTTVAPWSGRAFLKVSEVQSSPAPAKLLNKEISDIIHGNKTKDREFDIVKQLKKGHGGHDGVCGSNAISLKRYENNPEAAQKFNEITKDALENGSYRAVKTEGDGVSYLGPQASSHPDICLGVIFHQLIGHIWVDSSTQVATSPEVTEAYCKDLISDTNIRLAGQGSIPATWSSVVSDSKIKLKFEKLNIISLPCTSEAAADCHGGTFDFGGAVDVHPHEDSEHFVNVYIANISALGWAELGGLSTWPDDYEFVLNGQNTVFGVDPYFPPEGTRDTFAHELGHLFGLEHIWGPTDIGDTHSCSDDDNVSDTPAQFGPGQGADGETPGECNNSTDTCSGGGRDMYENIMGYPDWMCSPINWAERLFTTGQGDKMRASILSSPYIDTLNSSGCEDLTTTPPPVIPPPTGCHPCNDCGGTLQQENWICLPAINPTTGLPQTPGCTQIPIHSAPLGQATFGSQAECDMYCQLSRYHLYKEWTPDS